MNQSAKTAIVTGAGKRVGLAVSEFLAKRGWTVVAHVRRSEDAVPDGMVKVAADLADENCAETIFAAAEGLAPVRLLVNNAARFAHDGFGSFSTEEFERHIGVNLRAPLLLGEALSKRHDPGEEALIVNILDSKLAAPNPDFVSYTLSKQGLAGLTELSARAYAGQGIRVNAIAPALMLRSPGQSEANFQATHERNPLHRGVRPDDVVRALDYLINAPAVTGEILTIDSGQRFEPPPRDPQYLEVE